MFGGEAGPIFPDRRLDDHHDEAFQLPTEPAFWSMLQQCLNGARAIGARRMKALN